MRNQLVHGGATWNSKVNREQMRDCANFMGCLVPAIIQIMMDNKAANWEQPCYPVVPQSVRMGCFLKMTYWELGEVFTF